VAAPYSVWQRFPLCPIESNVNENFKVIQNPGFLPDHPQNWTTGRCCHSRYSQKISERSVHNFLSYLADTDRQTKSGKNITSLAEVNIFGSVWLSSSSSLLQVMGSVSVDVRRLPASSSSVSCFGPVWWVVLCDTWNWSHDNNTISGIEYRDNIAIPKVVSNVNQQACRREGRKVFFCPRDVGKGAIAQKFIY